MQSQKVAGSIPASVTFPKQLKVRFITIVIVGDSKVIVTRTVEGCGVSNHFFSKPMRWEETKAIVMVIAIEHVTTTTVIVGDSKVIVTRTVEGMWGL